MAVLSIIVPVFNKEFFVDTCIKSILMQSFTYFELIIVNDGSTDNSGDKCNYYSSIDNRVTVIHKKNEGVSSARNAGLKISTGKYIGFVDADDVLETDMYETLIKNATTFDADIVACGVRKIFPEREQLFYGTQKILFYARNEALEALLKKDIAQSVYDKIYRADIAKNATFTGGMYEDVLYNFLIISQSKKMVFNDVIKYNYMVRNNSISVSKFTSIWMDAIYSSKKIVEICREKIPELLDEALVFNLITNISVFNWIILSERKLYHREFKEIVTNLNNSKGALKNVPLNKKHKYANSLILLSPIFYAFLMRLYCSIFDTEMSTRKKALAV